MSIAQLAPGASVDGHAARLASAKPAPAIAIEAIARFALPAFVSVTVRFGYRPPSVCEPKSSVAGARFTSGAGTGTPVPDSAIVAGPLLASEAIVSDAVREPSAVGWNVSVS